NTAKVNTFAGVICGLHGNASALPKGVQKEHLPHHLQGKCSVLHCTTADGQKQEFLFVRLQILSERR
ncbi:MAG TPA: hypothetical protein DEB10_04220, partial [Ruminococcaceae bacterium]|nr:hypothetical protein [Oscillospiraceae bacterium]